MLAYFFFILNLLALSSVCLYEETEHGGHTVGSVGLWKPRLDQLPWINAVTLPVYLLFLLLRRKNVNWQDLLRRFQIATVQSVVSRMKSLLFSASRHHCAML